MHLITQPQRGVSRRAVLNGLLGIAVIAGGDVALYAIEHMHSSAISSSPPPLAVTVPQHSSTPVPNKPLIHRGAGKEYTVSWSPDGTKIASAGNGEIIEAWDSTSGNSLFNLVSGAGTVYSVVWSPDSERVASASDDQTVQLWQVP